MASTFQRILQQAVEQAPGAIGGAFSAFDGELVDAHGVPSIEWDLFAAHFGVVLQGIQAALHTLHFGDAEHVILEHRTLDVLIMPVSDGYYLVLATQAPMAIAQALHHGKRATALLRVEMGY